VDAATTGLLGSLSWGRFQHTLGAAIIEVDPAAAKERAEADRLRQHVTLGRSDEQGLKLLIIRAQAGDLIVAKAFIDRLAEILAREGDTDPAEVRQATAAGILLGNPYRAVTLFLKHATQPTQPANGTQPAQPANGTQPAQPANGATPGSGAGTGNSSAGQPSGGAGGRSDGPTSGPDTGTGSDTSTDTGTAAGSSPPVGDWGVLDLWRRRHLDPDEIIQDPRAWPMPPPGEPPVPEPPFPDPLAGHQDPADDPPPDADPPADADPAEPPQPTTNGQAPARPPQPDTGDPWCGLPPPAPDRPDDPLLPFDPEPGPDADPDPGTDTEAVGQRDVHPCADDADDVEEDCPTCHGTGHTPPQPCPPAEAELIAALADAIRTGHLKPDKLFGPATLYVHLSAHALWHTTHPEPTNADTTSSSGEASGDADDPSDEPGRPEGAGCPHCAAGEPLPAVTRVEDTPAGPIGPTLLDQTRQWLGHHRVSLKPVIDLNRNHAVDGYEVPAWMSEILHLSNPGSVWPYSPNTSRTKDTDHTIPYQPENNQTENDQPGNDQPENDEQPGGEDQPEPEQQTRLDNLGRLERRTHRVKTFGHGWQHHQPERGVHLWRSPHGHWYRVDHTGTHRLGKHPDRTEHGICDCGMTDADNLTKKDPEVPDQGEAEPGAADPR
jgi:hypothetical protein